ncbi:MAG: hypothetical protein ACREM3_21805 [Candidatus Rokuibacteriota bacterium]
MRLFAVLGVVALGTLPVVLSSAPDAFAQAAPRGAPRVWIRVEGAVQKVEGDSLTVRLPDGRRMVADISRMPRSERAALVAGERTALSGYTDQRAGRFVAMLVESETTAATPPSAGGPVAASASASMPAVGAFDERPWRLVHGRVDRIDADTLTLVTDAGRTVAVDLRGVEPANRAAVARGESVTAVGFHSGDLDYLDARFIHRDASESSGRRAEAPGPSRVR